MSLLRNCDSCLQNIPGTNWWRISLRDTKTNGSSMRYDLCDSCRRKVMDAIGIFKKGRGGTDAVVKDAARTLARKVLP
jgi:hypothetical protein